LRQITVAAEYSHRTAVQYIHSVELDASRGLRAVHAVSRMRRAAFSASPAGQTAFDAVSRSSTRGAHGPGGGVQLDLRRAAASKEMEQLARSARRKARHIRDLATELFLDAAAVTWRCREIAGGTSGCHTIECLS